MLYLILQMNPFNPIKVLFLPSGWNGRQLSRLDFQSYQGSIFTEIIALVGTSGTYFQSYQGSIFTEYSLLFTVIFQSLSILSRFYFYKEGNLNTRTLESSFNPIKVLFLRERLTCRSPIIIIFQSYQGSIFTCL